MITKQEGGCHRQRTKDHGEKLGSGLTEVNMTSDGGVPYDMQISPEMRTCPHHVV